LERRDGGAGQQAGYSFDTIGNRREHGERGRMGNGRPRYASYWSHPGEVWFIENLYLEGCKESSLRMKKFSSWKP